MGNLPYTSHRWSETIHYAPVLTRFPFLNAQTPDAYPRTHQYFLEIPRTSYFPLLAERTAYSSGLTYTNDFSNVAWGKVNLTPTANVLANPNDGAATAARLLETVSYGEHNTYAGYTFASVTPHIFTVFIAGGLGRDWVRLRVYDGTVDRDAWFNVSTGAVSSAHATEFVRMPNPGQAWWRATICITPTSAAVGGVAIAVSSDGSTTSYTGDTAKGIYLWCANIRPGSISSIGPAVEALGSIRTVLCPDLDPDDCFAYLVAESEPQPVLGDLLRVERTYARLPAQQLTRDYQSFARPNCSGLRSGGTYAANLDGDDSFRLWTSRKAVLGYQTTVGGSAAATLPSGTVTVTLSDASNASFAANASVSTIQSAVNASLVGGSKLARIDVAKTDSVLVLWIFYASGGATVSSVSNPSGTTLEQTASMIRITAFGTIVTPDTRLVSCPSHGAAAGERVAMWNGHALVARGTVAGITDANYLSIILSDLESPDFNFTHLTLGDDATARYAAGASDINVRIARDFYLPGVTLLTDGSTLSSLDSLPAVSIYASPQAWLDRIVAADTYTAINASQLGTYAGPIVWRDTVSAKKDATCLESLSLT